MAALRIVFMGTPELAGASFEALLHAPALKVVGVVTQPDQPKGRGMKLQASPVKEIAQREKLPVLQPERARSEELLHELQKLQPDLIAVAAYGQILPQSILDLPRFGCLNVHTSLLPKYRGAAPIQWAVLNGEAETGVTIMKMDAGLDTGDILSMARTAIQTSDTSETLHQRLAAMGAELLVKTISEYTTGSITPRPQPAAGASYAPKIKKQDGRLDWNQPAAVLWNRVRGLVPWPGAFTQLVEEPKPQLLKIWEATVASEAGRPGEVLQADKSGIVIGCGVNALRVLVLQREGGRRITAQEFLAGHPLPAGQRFE